MAGSMVFLDHGMALPDVQDKIFGSDPNSRNRLMLGTNLIQFIQGMILGVFSTRAVIRSNCALATGTVTLAAHIATHTVTVAGVVFTCVASGAAANQYNVGATDALTALNLAASINASVTAAVQYIVRAVGLPDSAVVRIEGAMPGVQGNTIALAISAGGSVSGATLTGGANGTLEQVCTFGSAAL